MSFHQHTAGWSPCHVGNLQKLPDRHARTHDKTSWQDSAIRNTTLLSRPCTMPRPRAIARPLPCQELTVITKPVMSGTDRLTVITKPVMSGTDGRYCHMAGSKSHCQNLPCHHARHRQSLLSIPCQEPMVITSPMTVITRLWYIRVRPCHVRNHLS